MSRWKFLAIVFLAGCAHRPPCKPLEPFKIGGKTVFPVVCSRAHINRACKSDVPVNACTYLRGKKCWFMMADDERGAKASFHEVRHCAGGSEEQARCDDWPGTVGPPDEKCVKSPRGKR